VPKPIHFKHAELPFTTTTLPEGQTTIARVVNAANSKHMGAGLEILERISLRWTVTYDEVLFIHEGRLTVRTGGETFDCTPGDIVWLPSGTTLDYDASGGRCAYFYALYPVDWAAQQGIEEP
jgi:ethanolamine utilization protein EutQ